MSSSRSSAAARLAGDSEPKRIASSPSNRDSCSPSAMGTASVAAELAGSSTDSTGALLGTIAGALLTSAGGGLAGSVLTVSLLAVLPEVVGGRVVSDCKAADSRNCTSAATD